MHCLVICYSNNKTLRKRVLTWKESYHFRHSTFPSLDGAWPFLYMVSQGLTLTETAAFENHWLLQQKEESTWRFQTHSSILWLRKWHIWSDLWSFGQKITWSCITEQTFISSNFPWGWRERTGYWWGLVMSASTLY